VQRLAREVGDVDILINNAGVALFAPTAEFEVSAFDTMFASNVRAPFFLVAAFAPGMAARGHGSIVSLSSMAGGVGLVGGAAYGATKSLEAMTRAGPRVQRKRRARIAIARPRLHPSVRPEFITALGETTPCTAPRNPRGSPRSSHSSPSQRATSPAPSQPTAARNV
jgi:NADP-dependent 3-hydroxy acid dehydrogenase YdfG